MCGRQAIGGLTHPLCKGRYDIDGVFASLVYRGITKKLIYQFKFQPFLTDVRNVMGDLFYEGLIQQELFFTALRKDAVVVPIPLYKQRERERGYNQSMILASDLGKRLQLPVFNLLERIRQTRSQIGKTQEERRENIKGAFSVKEGYKKFLVGKTVFLVDDVVTSGATMNEAAKTLKKAKTGNVYGLAFAHGV